MVFWIIGALGLVLLVASLILDDLIASLDFGPEWLSGTAIGGFLAAFGLLGGLVAMGTSSQAYGALAGLAGGVAVSVLAALLTRSLSRSGSGSAFTPEGVVGCVGTVVTRISPPSLGEVSVSVKGHPVKFSARAEEELPAGASVVVVASLSATLLSVRRSEA